MNTLVRSCVFGLAILLAGCTGMRALPAPQSPVQAWYIAVGSFNLYQQLAIGYIESPTADPEVIAVLLDIAEEGNLIVDETTGAAEAFAVCKATDPQAACEGAMLNATALLIQSVADRLRTHLAAKGVTSSVIIFHSPYPQTARSLGVGYDASRALAGAV